jgi:hypothetical protein
MTKEEARVEIGGIARDVLSGAVSYIEGARKIASLGFLAGLDTDPDVLPFVGIDSETDALPLGQARKHWHERALTNLQPDIEKAEAWAREFGHSPAARLAIRFSKWPTTRRA